MVNFTDIQGHYNHEGAELVDFVMDIVCKEAKGCDCLHAAGVPSHILPQRRNWIREGNTSHLQGQGGVPGQDHELLLGYPIA